MNDGTDDLEHKYWKSLSLVDNPNPISTPIYAADIEDTVTDPHIKVHKSNYRPNILITKFTPGLECCTIALHIGYRTR